jgi:FkbM family methyltransferase
MLMRKYFRGTFLHRSRIANIFYQFLWRLLADNDSTRSVSFRNLTIAVPSNEITILPSLIDGSYEFEEINYFLAQLEPNAVVLDIGANIGVFSLPIANHLTQGFVYAFEPSSESARLLEQNALKNGLRNIEVIEMAASSVTGQHHFLDSVVGGRRRLVEGREGREVAAIKIDDWIAEREVYIDAVKIDVEGWESSVLRGMPNLLKSKPMLLMECNIAAQGPNIIEFSEQLRNLFKNYNQIVSFDGSRTTVHKSTDWQDIADSKVLLNLIFIKNP